MLLVSRHLIFLILLKWILNWILLEMRRKKMVFFYFWPSVLLWMWWCAHTQAETPPKTENVAFAQGMKHMTHAFECVSWVRFEIRQPVAISYVCIHCSLFQCFQFVRLRRCNCIFCKSMCSNARKLKKPVFTLNS